MNRHEYDELIRLFLRPDQFDLRLEGDPGRKETPEEKDRIKRNLYHALAERTGVRPPWGIITGIRPVKLAGELIRKSLTEEAVAKTLRERYLLSAEKIRLALEIYRRQMEALGDPAPNTAGIYIGIPFCPTRCLYCSFASNQVEEEAIDLYLAALHREIRAVGQMMKERGITAESVYIGGGTPTTLTADQLSELLAVACRELPATGGDGRPGGLRELTVEAGRPDTITAEKLSALAGGGATRISINPQSMQDETLRRIGRDHTADDVRRAMKLVRRMVTGQQMAVNMDIIAGLPGETEGDFADTLKQVVAMEPEDITVHSLAIKRTSRLREEDPQFHYRQGKLVGRMLDQARHRLAEAGYDPYYLYRQKQMSGAQENTGYAKAGHESLYNVRIMDEHQHIIAMGAGGISKVYYPEENRLERVPNVTNYEIYMERIEEMIRRKTDAYQST